MPKLLLSILIAFLCYAGHSQDSLFSRLRGIRNGGLTFYNVDGIEITSQTVNTSFSKKSIVKAFRKFTIKENDLSVADSSLPMPNYYVVKSSEVAPATLQHTAYYFIGNASGGYDAITFGSINKEDREFEHSFIGLIRDNKIPATVYDAIQMDSMNFAGRKIALNKSCQWMGINNMQCPSFGQMNWSIHKTMADAQHSVENQYALIKAKKNGKITAEESVNVIFEGADVPAKRIIFDVKGISSVLVGLSGGKTLTVYFVAAAVRQNFVSCVMSFWNNDVINPSGLPPFLEEVMVLK